MRGLSFYAHAVGTAAFPGLVLADGLGFSAPLGAFAAALVFAFGVERLARRPRAGYDSLTALVLVAALAGGVVLASDVFHSGGNVDSLLFGSLLLTGTRDLVLAGLASAAAVAAHARARAALARPGIRPGLGARSGPALAACRTPCCSCSSPSRSSPRSRRSERCSRPRCSSCPRRPCASGRSAWLVWQLASVALAAIQGIAGPVALGRAQHAARADDRRARWRAVRAVGALARIRRRGAAARRARRRGCAARARPRCLRWRLVARGHAVPGSSPRRRRSATGRARSRATRRACIRSSSPTAIRTTTSRGRPTSRPSRARSSCSSTATASTPGWAP